MSRKLALLVAFGLFLVTHDLEAQAPARTVQRRALVLTLRAPSGVLSAGETTTAVDVSSHASAEVTLALAALATPDADDHVEFHMQTTYDGGTTWCDMEQVDFAQADNGTTPKLVFMLGATEFAATDVAAACTDGAIADDTKKRIPIGGQLRIKVIVEGATSPSYNWSAGGLFH